MKLLITKPELLAMVKLAKAPGILGSIAIDITGKIVYREIVEKMITECNESRAATGIPVYIEATDNEVVIEISEEMGLDLFNMYGDVAVSFINLMGSMKTNFKLMVNKYKERADKDKELEELRAFKASVESSSK